MMPGRHSKSSKTRVLRPRGKAPAAKSTEAEALFDRLVARPGFAAGRLSPALRREENLPTLQLLAKGLLDSDTANCFAEHRATPVPLTEAAQLFFPIPPRPTKEYRVICFASTGRHTLLDVWVTTGWAGAPLICNLLCGNPEQPGRWSLLPVGAGSIGYIAVLEARPLPPDIRMWPEHYLWALWNGSEHPEEYDFLHNKRWPMNGAITTLPPNLLERVALLRRLNRNPSKRQSSEARRYRASQLPQHNDTYEVTT